MWRPFFLGMGISAVLLGGEFLATDRFILAGEAKQASQSFFTTAPKRREYIPPEWAPWSLLSGGTIVILYSLTLPKPGSGGGEG